MSKKILIEGKKEEVAKKLKQKFEHDTKFIDKVLNIDPTGYKYVDYLANQLSKIIPQLSGPKGGLNVDQRTAIYDVFYQIIPWFHNNFNKITSDDVWKTETKYRQRHGVFDNINNLVDNPKDINQYTNPTFLEELMEVVDSRKTNKELERELKLQAEKIYEDDSVLVVLPKTYAASCYYGANTKWCTTTRVSSHYFRQYAERGELYYFINKENGNKMALHVDDKSKEKEVYDSNDKKVEIKDLRNSFPNQDELIDELVGTKHLIKALKGFVRKKVSSTGLQNYDDGIAAIKEREPLGQSIIIINFGDDETFFKTLDIDEDDVWFMNAIMSSYSGYEFRDSYQIEEDFKEGYSVWYELNDENAQKMRQIASLILPNQEYNIENEVYRQELSVKLLDMFPKEMDWILGDYHSEKENEMHKTARESISSELDGFVESTGFNFYRKYYELSTTVANLIMWATRLQIEKTDIISLFNQIVQHKNIRLGGWNENSYEYQDSANFDMESFNRTVEKQLDEILEKLDDDEGFEKFLEFRNKIESKYKLNRWYDLPKDKEIKFKLRGFDKDKMKVQVEINARYKGHKNYSFDMENFNKFLYQPELFDLFGDYE